MSEPVKTQYPAFDEESGKVICQICGGKFLVISPKHLLKHGISYADYTKRYPDVPLSSKEFSAKAKYGKIKDLFKPTNDSDEIIVEEEPTIEDDFDIDAVLKERSYNDPVKQSKAQVLDTLRSYFSNIRQDYMIEEYGRMSGRLKYQFITDFTDPILRIVIQFPNTFWHNNDRNIDPLKNQKLEQDGWKVLVVTERAPTNRDIQRVVDSM